MRLKVIVSLWAVILFCLSYSLVIAQNAPASQEGMQQQAASSGVQERLQQLSTALELTDSQKQQIKPVLEQEVYQLRAIRQDGTLSENEKEAKMKQVHDYANGQIQSVLTPVQQQKLAQMRANGMQQH